MKNFLPLSTFILLMALSSCAKNKNDLYQSAANAQNATGDASGSDCTGNYQLDMNFDKIRIDAESFSDLPSSTTARCTQNAGAFSCVIGGSNALTVGGPMYQSGRVEFGFASKNGPEIKQGILTVLSLFSSDIFGKLFADAFSGYSLADAKGHFEMLFKGERDANCDIEGTFKSSYEFTTKADLKKGKHRSSGTFTLVKLGDTIPPSTPGGDGDLTEKEPSESGSEPNERPIKSINSGTESYQLEPLPEISTDRFEFASTSGDREMTEAEKQACRDGLGEVLEYLRALECQAYENSATQCTREESLILVGDGVKSVDGSDKKTEVLRLVEASDGIAFEGDNDTYQLKKMHLACSHSEKSLQIDKADITFAVKTDERAPLTCTFTSKVAKT